jgi:hypothetical protein
VAYARLLYKMYAVTDMMEVNSKKRFWTMSEYIEPQLGAESFSCPHCNTVAHQDWYSLFLKPENTAEVRVLTPEAVKALRQSDAQRDNIKEIDQFVERLKKNALTYEYQKHPHPLKVKMANLHISNCHSCNGFSLWVRGVLVFPTRIDKTPELVEEDLEEAAAILNKFPRGATALMRVCIQKLVPLLEDNGKELNQRVSSLVRKGLEMEIQQAMDVLQVLRSDSTQLNPLRSEADRETALRFLDSLKEVLERRMSRNRDET